jgi:hypothetical protein
MFFLYFIVSLAALAAGSVTASGMCLLYAVYISQQALFWKNRLNKLFLYGLSIFILGIGFEILSLGQFLVDKYRGTSEIAYMAMYVVTIFLFTSLFALNIKRRRRKQRDEIH